MTSDKPDIGNAIFQMLQRDFGDAPLGDVIEGVGEILVFLLAQYVSAEGCTAFFEQAAERVVQAREMMAERKSAVGSLMRFARDEGGPS